MSMEKRDEFDAFEHSDEPRFAWIAFDSPGFRKHRPFKHECCERSLRSSARDRMKMTCGDTRSVTP